ncbi:putative calcium-binding protein CML45 [Apostasia shenzhenica]|uniref:Putative calcium-binding protein CML45 n=1 Tax=Apostasia shenzhenica TaxID=1088818 RepID=A0A2I0A5A0_9ASPA|nr:putative calcium-binding protein CML45 [Apostasia shenzhenica]
MASLPDQPSPSLVKVHSPLFLQKNRKLNESKKTMEKTPLRSLLPSEFIVFVILEAIIFLLARFCEFIRLIHGFLPSSSSIIQVEQAVQKIKQIEAVEAAQETEESTFVSRRDVQVVMEKMGIRDNRTEEKLEAFMGPEEIAAMFEEEEPSMEELKEAFGVFDANGDGVVDAGDLQKVLCKLGFAQRLELHSCKQMIAAHDEDGDERIDFAEFVRLMETNFC